MVNKSMMSRTLRIFLALFLLLPCFMVQAADDPMAELIYRASLGRADDVSLLIKNGASPDAKNEDGVPVLALAAARKDLEGLNVVQVLVENKADIEATDHNGQTAIFYAAKQGNVPIVNYLLEQHVNAYVVDTHGNQPRMVAYLAGQQDVVAALDSFALKETANVHQQTHSQEEIQQLKVKQDELAKKQDQLAEETHEIKQQLSQQQITQQQPTVTNDEMRKAAMNMAFNTCAFQYWSYCGNKKQSTELTPEELDVTIASYQEQAEHNKNDLAYVQKMSIPQINDMITSVENRIFNELNVMPSNIERHEEGVGKHTDMERRCNKIAAAWDAPVPDLMGPKSDTVVPNTSQPKDGKPKSPAKKPANSDPTKLRKVSDDFVTNLHPQGQ